MISNGKRGEVADAISEPCGEYLAMISGKSERFTGESLFHMRTQKMFSAFKNTADDDDLGV